jgi:hypothetical protein
VLFSDGDSDRIYSCGGAEVTADLDALLERLTRRGAITPTDMADLCDEAAAAIRELQAQVKKSLEGWERVLGKWNEWMDRYEALRALLKEARSQVYTGDLKKRIDIAVAALEQISERSDLYHGWQTEIAQDALEKIRRINE